LFSATGNAELSNEMASYTANQKMFVIRILVVLVAAEERRFRGEISSHAASSRDTARRVAKQLERAGSV
jgi:hypothetical protein